MSTNICQAVDELEVSGRRKDAKGTDGDTRVQELYTVPRTIACPYLVQGYLESLAVIKPSDVGE